MYAIKFTRKSLIQIKKLDNLLKERIFSSLERCRIRPHSRVKKLVNNRYCSLRVGNYRIILDIRDQELIIMVIELGHRRNIYK